MVVAQFSSASCVRRHPESSLKRGYHPRMKALDALDPAGRCALVTGASSGIGRAIALRLAAAGARVALLGRNPERLAAVATEIVAADGEAFVVPCDLTQDRQVTAALKMAAGVLGPIEVLVNNAGIAHSAPLARTTDEDIDRVIALNLRAAFMLARALAPAMQTARYGRIVNIGSTAALRGFAYCALYTASKHALAGLTRSLSAELLSQGITVNLVCPGYTDTPLVDRAADAVALKTGRSDADVKAHFAQTNPLGRLVQPDEVAAAVLYLVGPGSGAISGHSLVLDGGTQPA